MTTLFVKKLPKGCTEVELRAAFGAASTTVHAIKLLKNRRAIVDVQHEPAAGSPVDQLIAAKALTVSGLSCPLILPDNGGIKPGGASQPDSRALEAHVCPVCALSFPTQKKLTAHMADGLAHRPPPPVWNMDRLQEFDLSPNTMVAAMDTGGREALDDYIAHAAPKWPELPAIISHISEHHPTSLRLKELLETLECFRVVGQFIYEQYASRKRRIGGGGSSGSGSISSDSHAATVAANSSGEELDKIVDLACGHGLLGVLLAYRFPDVAVECIDLEPRPCWEHYRQAWAAAGRPAEGHPVPLDNLHFVQKDVADVPTATSSLAVPAI